MKVIVLEDDRIENVSDGYARNYLLPRKLAILATPQAIASTEKRREKRKTELEQKRAEMRALAEKLEKLEIEISADAGEGGKLFGSITSADIAQAASQLSGAEIDKKKIELEEPIKVVGEHKVTLKLFSEVTAALKVKVSPK
jgi:large subunit ribosomal protein L9